MDTLAPTKCPNHQGVLVFQGTVTLGPLTVDYAGILFSSLHIINSSTNITHITLMTICIYLGKIWRLLCMYFVTDRLERRMFSTSDFLIEHSVLVPSGFNMFQTAWDDSVSNVYQHILSE